MSRRLAGVTLLALLACGSAGCSGNQPAGSDERIRLTVVDRAQYDAVLAALRGKVVVVDCWATWCVPCLELLPHSGELARDHRDGDLAVVTLSFDSPDKLEQLKRQLDFPGTRRVTHLVSQFGSGTQSMTAFEIPNGALPHYKLYDRTGALRQTFQLDPAAETQFTSADVDAALSELLAE